MSKEMTCNQVFGFWMYVFFRPACLMWCLEYFHDDLGAPMLSYWKCFWLLFAVGCFYPLFYHTKRWEDY